MNPIRILEWSLWRDYTLNNQGNTDIDVFDVLWLDFSKLGNIEDSVSFLKASHGQIQMSKVRSFQPTDCFNTLQATT